MQVRRRLALQLTPLLDMMLIVIFAQYMEVQQTAQRQAQEAKLAVVRSTEAEAELARDQQRMRQQAAELARTQAEQAALQAELDKQRIELSAALQTARTERDRIAALAARLFAVSDDALQQALGSDVGDGMLKLKQAMAQMPVETASDLAKQMLVIDALRRTTDIWDIHIDDNGVTRVSAGRDSVSFRADTPAEFSEKLWGWYRTLPAPQRMVMILISWADATAGARQAAQRGIAGATERMRNELSGKTLFDQIVVGFKPRAE